MTAATTYQVCDHVYLADADNTEYGRRGTVEAVDTTKEYPYAVRLAGDRFTFWYPAYALSRESPVSRKFELRVRMNAKERSKLLAAAHRARLTVSDYVRGKIGLAE